MPEPLSDRQRREIEYHRSHASEAGAALLARGVWRDIIEQPGLKWWNPLWCAYRRLFEKVSSANAPVLVVGCGFGEDAVRLALSRLKVCAFDLSPDCLLVARRLAEKEGVAGSIEFIEASAERLPYSDGFFAAALAVDILHHVDIPAAMREVLRVLEPGGVFVSKEPYTHSRLDQVAAWPRRKLHRLLAPVVYGTSRPYITADERKLNERDIDGVVSTLAGVSIDYFNLATGRVLNKDWAVGNKIERRVLQIGGGRWLAGNVVITGRKPKS